jgi:hypothetical protein
MPAGNQLVAAIPTAAVEPFNENRLKPIQKFEVTAN